MVSNTPTTPHETPSRNRTLPAAQSVKPRVVIFDGVDGPLVEVVELRPPFGIGALVEHLGRPWRVTAMRTHNRVLICRHVNA